MTLLDRITLFSPADLAACMFLILCWLGIGWRIENAKPEYPSVSGLMAEFRHAWMIQMVQREPRIFDAQLISNLRQGSAFFASASMIAIGGGLALIGNTDQLAGVAQDLSLESAPAFVWDVKILMVLLLLSNAFLKYVWAHRLFGYCFVLMAAVPNTDADAQAYPRASQAADLSITAARSFNRAMRSTYFALAAVAWLIGSWALIAATLVTFAVLYRREFASQSRSILQRVPANTTPPTPDATAGADRGNTQM
ncbi:DUF599 domain-containing protein [Phaeobacter inhibens]|uniref:DUF599 domain-containing protein n=1 Tax=Phaeobacter inhibens TaxID=221822 RepID=UPI0021A70C16|nr:DUF599 domain-containing protein [Phaeobacter inhibens]UWR58485.1 DUF599 domain-containing protein [Phaeobacter inhibens]UWR75717.1 DUF599 domain-containing protein [Phaeobacter inhibens]